MKKEILNQTDEKKIWNVPRIFVLNVKKTESGSVTEQTEDFASGTINTQPSE